VQDDQALSVRRQCDLLGTSRSGWYYLPKEESPENLRLMRRLDELNLENPEYGRPRLTALLRREGWPVNQKRIHRLMSVMGMEAIYPRQRTSQPEPMNEIYPYLLRKRPITGPDQVWCADITYIPMRYGFMYLVAVMDWWSRFVLSWELSNTLEARFCVAAWKQALLRGRGTPLISNTDQGAQFTAREYLDAVEDSGVQISMDGRGRWMDNRFIERLWRSLKYEDVYLRSYEDGSKLRLGLRHWFVKYNQHRPHQALGYATPEEVYHAPESHGAKPATWA
jgi:putative transposase